MIAFQHSGRQGDIIYSLVACLERSRGLPFDFHLHTNKRDDHDPSHRGVMQTPAEAEFLASLLREQPYIRNLTISDNDCVPARDVGTYIDLDRFREIPVMDGHLEIRYWYKRIMAVRLTQIDKPWITIPATEHEPIRKICICFTERYQPAIDPAVLKPFDNALMFIGLPKEHKRFCSMYFPVDYHAVNSLKEMVQYVSKSYGWVSNICGSFAAMEGAAIPRVLCVPPAGGDVRAYTPHGKCVIENTKLLKAVEALLSTKPSAK